MPPTQRKTKPKPVFSNPKTNGTQHNATLTDAGSSSSSISSSSLSDADNVKVLSISNRSSSSSSISNSSSDIELPDITGNSTIPMEVVVDSSSDTDYGTIRYYTCA